jgi:F-type H+-transporting ATPase subunit epsilon
MIMAREFFLKVITQEKTVFEGNVLSLNAPGAAGYLGVLAGHAALITNLIPGVVTFKVAGSIEPLVLRSLAGGFLEVSANRAMIVVDQIA